VRDHQPLKHLKFSSAATFISQLLKSSIALGTGISRIPDKPSATKILSKFWETRVPRIQTALAEVAPKMSSPRVCFDPPKIKLQVSPAFSTLSIYCTSCNCKRRQINSGMLIVQIP